jgi:hypothetical protein
MKLISKKFPLKAGGVINNTQLKKPPFFQKTNNHIIPYKLINLRIHKIKLQ